MQIVDPIDIEDALRSDMAELLPDIAFHATPAPNDIEADSVAFMAVGGGAASPVSHEYDLGIDAWRKRPVRLWPLPFAFRVLSRRCR